MKRTKQSFEPLAIVGMSCMFPKAQSVEDYWANIKEKVDTIREVPADTHWDPKDFFDADKKKPDHVYTTTGGFLDPIDFNPGEWGIAPSDLDAIDTSQLLSLVVAQGALVDAGYTAGREFNRDNVSVILGLTGTLELVVPLGARLGHPVWRRAMQHAGIAPEITEEVIKNIGKAYVGWQENSFPGLLGNVAAGRVANRLNLGGTNCVVDAACGSSLSAVNLAAMELWTGKTDMAITGGVDTFNDIFMYMCFCKTPALSATGHARPFSVDNDGTILGEGIGMVVLKRLSDAERDGDRIYATLNSVGTSSDGKGKAIYAPSAEGQVKALRRAYEQAGISPRDISLIEAHGTGTGAGDEVEVNALKEIYGQADNGRPWCALGSVKSQIGHTKAAAGSAGLIKAALALYHKVIPPTIKVTKPAKALNSENIPFYLPDQLRPWVTDDGRPRYAAVSALGFGGSNFHVVVSEYDQEKHGWDWARGTEIFTFSGKNTADIKTALNKLAQAKNARQIRMAAAESRRDFNNKDTCRLTFVVDAGTDLNKLIGEITAQLDKNVEAGRFVLPNGVCFSQNHDVKPIGVIFPGQGAQYPGMSRELVCASPEAFTVLEEATREIGAIDATGNNLIDYVFPRPTYDAEKDKLNDERLRATDIAQPAIGAIALGQFKALEAFGVEANCFAGHSYGELVSLCAAGAFDSAALARISRKRGQLMAQGKGDRGGMIAVAAERSAVEAVIAETGLQLVVANHNSPAQVVLSGPTAEIEKSKNIFKDRKLRATVLNVAGAFHSSFVADAAEPFHAFLADEKFSKLKCPVYANTTAEVYPTKADAAKKLLGFQLANQVRFVEIIEKMYADGIRTFIEAGPGGKMTGLIKAILEGRDCTIIALDSSAGKRSGLHDLGRVLAQLASMGYQLDLSRWQNGAEWLAAQPKDGKPKLTFPLSGANYKSKAQLQAMAEIAKPAPVKVVAAAASVQAPQAPAAPVMAQTAAPRPAPPAPVAVAPAASMPAAQRQPVTMTQPQPVNPVVATNSNSAASRNMVPVTPAAPQANNLMTSQPVNLEALKLSRETLSALQQLQQQTADLHRRFLEGQEQAQKTIMALISGSQQMVSQAQPAVQQPQAWQQPMMPTAPVYVAPPQPVAQPVMAPAARIQTAPVAPQAPVRPVAAPAVAVSAPAPQPAPRPQAPAPVAAAAPVKTGPDAGKIRSILLDVVSEKTGYPLEMLNPDMDMEADLGIDSIKRVEILSAFQERVPEAPVVQPGDLGKFRTIAQILGYLNPASPAPAASKPAPVAAPVQSAPAPVATPAQTASAPTRVAANCPIRRTVLRIAELPAEASGPVVLNDGDRVIVTNDDPELADALVSSFAVQGIAAEKHSLTELTSGSCDENIKGLIVLAPVPERAAMNLWESPSEEWLKDVFMAVQKTGPVIRKNAGLVATIARLDGNFGLESITRTVDPVQGGLAGLIKTIRYEWPEVTPRAIDLDYRFKNSDDAAAKLTSELVCKGPIETGLTRSTRYTIEEVEAALSEDTDAPANFQKGDVVLVTGGARGVTAETAIAFAEKYKTTMVLLGRSPAPKAEPAWLNGLTAEPAIKEALLKNSGRKMTPKDLEAEFKSAMANREVLQNLARINQTGGKAFYYSVDIRNGEETERIIEQARAEAGQITGLIHGAGVLRDRRIEDKTREMLDDVIDTKVAGLRNVLKAVIKDNLKAVVLFSSFSGRGGRLGQVDYAMANEVLNKAAQKLRILRPECRVMSFNWGPWDGGMVTPALRNVFIAEGIGLIPLLEGARQPVIELSNPGENAVEIGIMGTLEEQGAPEPGKKFVKAFDFELNLKENAWLKDHVLNGDPVLPMAVAGELMSQAAVMRNPGLQFAGYDDMRILKGVVLKSQQVTLGLYASKPERSTEGYRVSCEIRTSVNGREMINARAEVLLADALPAKTPLPEKTDARMVYPDSINEAYASHLFHGEFFKSLSAVEGWSEHGIIAVSRSSQPPAAWFARPMFNSWCSDPLAIDAAYQLLILWTTQACGAPSLPGYARRYRQYVSSFDGRDVVIVARTRRLGSMQAAADIDFVDAQGRLIARLDGYECTLNENLSNAFKLRKVIGAE